MPTVMPVGRALRLVPLAAVMLTFADVSRADTPEYWGRETFKTERATFTASLSDEGDEERRPSRRAQTKRSAGSGESSSDEKRSARRAAAKSSVASDDTPAPSRKQARREKSVRVASLGDSFAPSPKPERSAGGGGGVRWVASSSCLNGTLRGVLAQVAARFGSVTVNSTCRSRSQNARAGGASRSMHLTGDAADFRVNGNWGAVSSFVRGLVGGFKHYGGGLFHIDTGERRTW